MSVGEGPFPPKWNGYCNWTESLIQIRRALSPNQSRRVVMHEIVHAMFGEIGRWDLSEDETLVDCVASQLILLLRNNPFISKLIDAEL